MDVEEEKKQVVGRWAAVDLLWIVELKREKDRQNAADWPIMELENRLQCVVVKDSEYDSRNGE